MNLKDTVHMWLNSCLKDPISVILAENSQLTKIQLETLLIDVLASNISGKYLKYDEKAALRLMKAKISRGAFNRTLKQAKENTIKSIYTVLLLGYLGVFENTTLDPYLELANKLHEYLGAWKNGSDTNTSNEERARIMETIRNELQVSLKVLAATSEEHL